MQDEQAHKARVLIVLILSALVVMVPGGAVFAKKPPKTYPEEGKVVGVGTGQHVSPLGAFGPHTVYGVHTYLQD
jgi:hypothetical protein